jgi:hypothetical protein
MLIAEVPGSAEVADWPTSRQRLISQWRSFRVSSAGSLEVPFLVQQARCIKAGRNGLVSRTKQHQHHRIHLHHHPRKANTSHAIVSYPSSDPH